MEEFEEYVEEFDDGNDGDGGLFEELFGAFFG